MNLLNVSAIAIMLLALCARSAVAADMNVPQSPPGCTGHGGVQTPESSVEKPSDIGERAHTNIEILVPPCPPQAEVHPHAGASGQAPASGASPPR